ncbi:DUF1501 domain-containing protein [Parasphingopyxis sp.]|uniref:DUF1501 domain-containing protein n=1 Tax=Parasphingopyxis sp. TaxID=1920299 RepID=UPI00260A4C5F|nr:DUF1501 domain-containing protein [Parasphingopyxis sp.]
MIDRRRFLRNGAAGAASLVFLPHIACAQAETDRRLVFIILRGAADALSMVAPTGDPQYETARRDFAGHSEGGARLDSFFTLHPALAETARLYASGDAAIFHAVASAYRDRSHFDGQNILETAGTTPYGLRDGWMNRLAGLLSGQQAEALALSSNMPMVLRGEAEASSYAPSRLPEPDVGLLSRVAMLYEGDEELHADWEQATETRELAGDVEGARRGEAATGELAARFLSDPEGPRIAAMEMGGWDTHRDQRRRLNRRFEALDAVLAALHSGLGPIWSNTLVIVATEFGRTVRPNGTQGSDHGTGSAALVLGGALRGGSVVADWPGLRPADLFEGRDLQPTRSLDRLFADLVADHFAIEPGLLRRTVFPAAGTTPVANGLIQT